MKKIVILFILVICPYQIIFSQYLYTEKSKLQLLYNNSELSKRVKQTSPLHKEDFDLNSATAIFVCVINPLLLFENEKIYFGLTKEISLAFPFFNSGNLGAIGRIGVEYSYIFRNERNHHLRSFLSTEIPIESGEFTAVTLGIGGGYFTDFKKNGIFPQFSLNLLIPVHEVFAVNPYVKLRHTFMLDKTQPNNTDISLGVGFMFLSLF